MSAATTQIASPALTRASYRRFFALWIGQLLTLLTISMTRIALGVWVFQQQGSAIQFATVTLSAVLPGLLVAPLVARCVDRSDRRMVMIIADGVLALGCLALSMMLSLGRLHLWHIYAASGLLSVNLAFTEPSYTATTTQLMPKQHLARFSGLMQLAGSTARIIAPALGGLLLALVGIAWVVALNVVSFGIMILILAMLRIPRLTTLPSATGSLGADTSRFAPAFAYLRSRPDLMLVLGYAVLTDFFASLVATLLMPMILAVHTQVELGTALSSASAGTVIGSLLMMSLGSPHRLMLAILMFDAGAGICIATAGIVTALPLLCLALLGSAVFSVMFRACMETLWQRKIPLDLQGRMFALKRMLQNATMPIAALSGGVLVDHAFEPWLAPDGWLAGNVGAWIGVGHGRGIGLLFVVSGGLTVVLTAVAGLRSQFRRLDQALPDAH